jgi:hypothetical protein
MWGGGAWDGGVGSGALWAMRGVCRATGLIDTVVTLTISFFFTTAFLLSSFDVRFSLLNDFKS